MIKLVIYPSQSQLWQFWQTFGHERRIYVAPHPRKADALREQAMAPASQMQVTTIAKFISDLLVQVMPVDERSRVKRKSELLRILASYKNRLNPSASYAFFMSAYQVLSDLRSFSVDDDFISRAIEHYEPELAQMILLFHMGMSRSGIWDDHQATFFLKECLRTDFIPFTEDTAIVFDGFSMMNGAQMDLLKALGIRYDVIIPIPRLAWEGRVHSDWISWLTQDRADIIQLPAQEKEVSKAIPAIWFDSGGVGKAVSTWCQKNHHGQLVLGSKDVGLDLIQSLPIEGIFYREEIQILASSIDRFFDQWSDRLVLKADSYSMDIFQTHLKERKWEIMAKPDIESLKELKVLLMVEDILVKSMDWISEQDCNQFFLQLLKTIVQLDAPRHYLVPLIQEDSPYTVLGLKDLEKLRFNRPVALVVDASYGALKSEQKMYARPLEKILSTIGPVKRTELEFLFLKSSMVDILTHADVSLLMTPDVLQHDLAWSDIVAHFKTEAWSSIEQKTEESLRPTYLLESIARHNYIPKRITASRLQAYLDCPQKFYFYEADNLIPTMRPTDEWQATELGMIEHDVMAQFWNETGGEWESFERLPEIARAKLVKMAGELKRPLHELASREAMSEIVEFTGNGLSMIKTIHTGLKADYKFETDWHGETLIKRYGRMDCLSMTESDVVLLDFKRNAVPEKKEWEEFDKIQLWFYLSLLYPHLTSKRITIGYVSLKRPEKSWLVTTSDEVNGLLSEFPGKIFVVPELITELLPKWETKQTESIKQMLADSSYHAVPKDAFACQYCRLLSVCQTGVSSDEESEASV